MNSDDEKVINNEQEETNDIENPLDSVVKPKKINPIDTYSKDNEDGDLER